MYADGFGLFVLSASLTSVSLSKKQVFDRLRHPDWGASFYLAAGAIAAVAAQVCAAGIVAVAAAAANQQNQNDDPPNTAAAEAITVTHNRYLRNSISEHWAHSMVFRRRKKVSADFGHISPCAA